MSDIVGTPVGRTRSPQRMASARQPAPWQRAAGPEVGRRVASAAVLVAISVVLLFAGPVPSAVLVLAVALLMAREWGHLVRGPHETVADVGVLLHAATLVVAVAMTVAGAASGALVVVIAGAVLALAADTGRYRGLSATGVAVLGGGAVALVWLRADGSLGLAVVLYLMAVVWTSDTMAFIVGRSVGGPRLCPWISPNKTWAGSVGGLLSSAAVGATVALAIPDASSLRLAALAMALSAVAQAGDLAESALKRRFGVKDASALIPGHGGMLDRADGITAVAIAAALLAVAAGGRSPATAILIGP